MIIMYAVYIAIDNYLHAGALSPPLQSRYGSGVGDTWLLNVQCNGSESRLTECDNDGWGASSLTTPCYHHISSDVSVECEGRKK